MNRFFTGVVKHRKGILILFALLFVLCLLAWRQVRVNYDMNDYLPDSAPSTVSLAKMQDEFSGGIPNARIMVPNLSIPQALRFKQQLEAIDGVADVMWLDDSVDITVPLSALDADTVETYYKNNTALYTVTIEKEKRISAVEAIRGILPEDGTMTGSAVSTAVATSSTVAEISKISLIAVAFVLVVLLVTTNSWLEPQRSTVFR